IVNLAFPSELYRPGFPVVSVINQFSAAGTANLALQEMNAVQFQEVIHGMAIPIAHKIPAIAEGYPRDGPAEDSGLQGLALGAETQHALQQRCIRDVGVASAVLTILRTFR